MLIKSGRRARPRRIMLYGVHGVGKSTFAAGAPRPLFFDVEGGIDDIESDKTDRLKTFGDVVAGVSWLLGNDTGHKTLVVDTLDWLERLIFADVAQANQVASIEKIGYGKGYKFAVDKWNFLLRGFDALREQRGMTILLLAHSVSRKIMPPDSESYNRYEPALHEESSRLIQEWCDEVLFASFRVFTRSEDQGFNKTRNIAIGGKDRYIRTSESASVLAKNRLRLPDEMPCEYMALVPYLDAANSAAARESETLPANIAGVVVDGSSKERALTNG